jgi:UDP-N-acetyl-D-glucosamine/UDP-N-acetyl-D-galactosamine dehydrogenase
MKICIVGLGYVGLPLAVEFGKKQSITGFDINENRIDELNDNIDSTGEISVEKLKKCDIFFTSNPVNIKKANFIIVAVPSPINEAKTPDLKYLKSASKIVGENLKLGSIVVFESTVYPGVTEDICVPILEKYSKLKCGPDFKIGYSPERINPGDKINTIDKIIKIVSGMDLETLDKVADVYETVIKAGVFRAKDIRTAEAAKAIENIQRDLNIALMNELSLIFEKMGINTHDVIDAAGSKWNFHKYFPGLVGGHCIGVDPYYLTYKAQQLGYDPQIILAGRHINEYMPKHVSELVIRGLSEIEKPLNECNVLIMGLTFKENISDHRNSKVLNIIKELKKFNVKIKACEPYIKNDDVKQSFGVENLDFFKIDNGIDCVVFVNPHDEFSKITLKDLKLIMGKKPILVDIRSVFNKEEAEEKGFLYKNL